MKQIWHDNVDPDYLFNSGVQKVTFIYTVDGILIADKIDGMHTHGSLIAANIKHGGVFEKYQKMANRAKEQHRIELRKQWKEPPPPKSKRIVDFDEREWLEKHAALFGRGAFLRLPGEDEYQSDNYVVSFWNSSQEIYSVLDECIVALQRGGHIPEGPVEIHTPFDVYLDERSTRERETEKRRGAGIDTELDPEVAERYRLQKQMHLMRGDEKKAARKKLGLWNDKTAKHPMGKELEKAGELGPGQKWWSPQSDDIQRLANVISESGFIDYWGDSNLGEIDVIDGDTEQKPRDTLYNSTSPDDIHVFGRHITTFIYTMNHQLVAKYDQDRGGTTHSYLLEKDDFWIPWYEMWKKDSGEPSDDWSIQDEWVMNIGLFGRVGMMDQSDYQIISFWNENPEMYKLLDKCIAALKEGNYISEEPIELHTPLDEPEMYDKVSTPFADTRKQNTTKPDPETIERFRLQRQLHLLRGDDKKRALKKLGLWNDKTAKHPMGGELEKAGLLGPGQKWWSPQSDDIQRLSTSISEDL